MKPICSMSRAFRRAASFFPTVAITVEAGAETRRAEGFCVASHEPPMVAFTLARDVTLPGRDIAIAGAGVKLTCALLESREVGDQRMFFAEVQRVEIGGGEALPVLWRRASFQMRFEYPFLESAEALEGFVKDWRSGVLPKHHWTHAAHVGATGYYAFNKTPEEVFAEMKRGILFFNSRSGVVDGPDSGYHETLTHFWSNRITQAVHAAQPQSRFEAARDAVQLFGEDRDLPFLFYSFDVVRNREARREWVAPDREPLLEWCGAR